MNCELCWGWNRVQVMGWGKRVLDETYGKSQEDHMNDMETS